MQVQQGYQVPTAGGPTTVVVVQQQPGAASWRNRGPQYLRQGVQISGFVLTFPCIICLGVFAALFVIAGIINIFMSSELDDDFFDDDDDNISRNVGLVLLLIGVGLTIACFALARYAKKKYESYRSADNPGRVINPSPSPNVIHQPYNPMQPGVAPPQGNQMPQHPQGPQTHQYPPGAQQYPPAPQQYPPAPQQYPPGAQMHQYPPASAHGGYNQVSYPYPQTTGYPVPTSAPGGAPPPYAPVAEKTGYYMPSQVLSGGSQGLNVPQTTLPGMPGSPSQPPGSEYGPPPPYAPDYKPPY